jgi:hypothetical protein
VNLRHVIEMRASGAALLQWLFVIRPLHNALLEDALDRAELYGGGRPRYKGWSPWVRLLRWAKQRAPRTRVLSSDR